MNSGTRRMWARRVLRAGWLLAPILQFPSAAFRFFFGTPDRRWLSGTVGTFALLVGSCTTYSIKQDSVATNEELKEALSNNVCMMELMPRRQEAYQRPLTNRDLSIGKSHCKEAYEKFYAVQSQKKVLNEQKAVLNAVVSK